MKIYKTLDQAKHDFLDCYKFKADFIGDLTKDDAHELASFIEQNFVSFQTEIENDTNTAGLPSSDIFLVRFWQVEKC